MMAQGLAATAETNWRKIPIPLRFLRQPYRQLKNEIAPISFIELERTNIRSERAEKSTQSIGSQQKSSKNVFKADHTFNKLQFSFSAGTGSKRWIAPRKASGKVNLLAIAFVRAPGAHF